MKQNSTEDPWEWRYALTENYIITWETQRNISVISECI